MSQVSVKLNKFQEKVLVEFVSAALHRDRQVSGVESIVSGTNQLGAPIVTIAASDWETNVCVDITVTLSDIALAELHIDSALFED